jgi:Fur family zinc uptake transcriptional regulator
MQWPGAKLAPANIQDSHLAEISMLQAVDYGELKLTRHQSLVLSVLQSSDQPLSAYRILDQLRDEGVKAPLQVYRALEKLMEAGRIHRLESLNAFVVCAHSKHGHIHPRVTAFEICESCGKVHEFHDEKIEEALADHARSSGFKTRSTTVEIRGLCDCCTDRRDGHQSGFSDHQM